MIDWFNGISQSNVLVPEQSLQIMTMNPIYGPNGPINMVAILIVEYDSIVVAGVTPMNY